MIITTDKQAEALGYPDPKENTHGEAPPAYAPAGPATSPGSPSTSSSPGIQATNNVYISRHHGTIKGTFCIDPSLYIPPELLAQSAGEWNLDLEAHHGSVEADVSLSPIRSAETLKQASLRLKSQHGGIKLVLHDVENRPPFRLQATSAFGTITLVIPRSFSGPITTTTVHGSVKLSESVNAAMTMFGEVDGTRRCFLGDFSRWQGRSKDSEDTSDEIVVESRYGGLKLQYEGEAVSVTRRARGGILSSIFGF
ncbi:hypothetical protein BD779DRAFT_1568830 [Infundibulicybe gibba]|nr:hypothetical protein BD779DRAFT_1568830 [Infundibulicybe gibba]